jgi:hypothetical protein
MEIGMKKLTATSLALTLALSCGATSALASSFEGKDLAFAFEPEGSMEVAALSEQEMKETEGAAVQFIPGGMIGVGSYGIQNGISAYRASSCVFCSSFVTNFTNSWDNRQAVFSAGVGALSGGLSAIALRNTGTTINYSNTLFLKSFHTPTQQFVNNQIRTYGTAPGLAITGSSFAGSSAANYGYSYINR